jgi:YgiT-type zinc finger domain-containing protein
MSEEALESTRPCNECGAGVMRLQFLTYFTWLDGELVTVPNFPAWVCDVCGRREYDSRAVSWLSILLNPDAGCPPVSRRRGAPPAEPPPTTRPAAK